MKTVSKRKKGWKQRTTPELARVSTFPISSLPRLRLSRKAKNNSHFHSAKDSLLPISLHTSIHPSIHVLKRCFADQAESIHIRVTPCTEIGDPAEQIVARDSSRELESETRSRRRYLVVGSFQGLILDVEIMSCKDGSRNGIGMDNGKYVRYTPEQVEALERLYHDCPKPSSIRRQQLIRECPILSNIEPKQIKVWFQNRRYLP